MSRRTSYSNDRVRLDRFATEVAAPTGLSMSGLTVIVVCGMLLTGLGLWHVHTVFRARDFQMETNRVQSLTSQRRDESKRLQVQLGRMRREDSLKKTALASFGMTDPEPGQVSDLVLPAERREQYRSAQERAEQGLEAERMEAARVSLPESTESEVIAARDQ